MKLTRLFFLLALLSNSAFAQLPNFDLQVAKTDETCLGNGSLTITTTNQAPSATMLYKVYKLPDLVNPVSILSTNYVGSLTSGTYKVIAIQALGNLSNTKEKNITINNNIGNFNYTISSSNQNCSTGGSLVVTTVSGIGTAYEIIAGPVTKPLQSSNVFSGLPGGTYKIRAFDNCGTAKVKTYTFSLTPSTLTISDTYYSDEASVICDSIQVNNLITPSSGSISYPLAVQFNLTPLNMAGDPIVLNQNYATGDSDSLVVSAVVPRYLTESYSYELRVVDNCNTAYEKINNMVDPAIAMSLDKAPLLCGDRYLKVNAYKHMAPYTIEFISAPAGFTPENFNVAGGGPFFEDTVNYGNEDLAVPFGDYVVKITDACGRTAQDSITIQFEPLQPSVVARNNGCFSLFGKIMINISQQKLVSASILAAPSAYQQVLPKDVTANINSEGKLTLTDMPIGTYIITFTDDCGFVYTEEVIVPPFVEKAMSISTLPGCTPGYGGVRIKGGNGNLVSVIMISAPVSNGSILPLDLSSNIAQNDGDLYIDNLQAGTYVFKATDICGVVETKTIEVIGYIPPQNSVQFMPNCGSFSVRVVDQGNGTEEVSYWLQKYNPATATWGHPNSNNVYLEGSVPTTANSIKLTNNVPRNNLSFVGQFRVLKKFETFGNATSDRAICLSIIGEFNFNDAFQISNAYTLACTGSPNDVYIEAQGYNIIYRIEKKDGVTFVVENGDNNVFTNLEPATYIFSIEDDCGNKLTKEFNLRELPSVADATQPLDMNICVEEGTSGSNVFHLTSQNSQILGALPSAIYTITYHLTQDDADNGVNPLPEYYTSNGNGQRIYARLVNNHITLCHGTTAFALFVGQYPTAQISTAGTICNDGLLSLTASAGFDNYIWSTGETTRTIYVRDAGVYSVIVQKEYGNRICEAPPVEVEIFASSAPTKITVDTQDWTRDENVITVHAEGAGQYEYSLDGINYQDSNVFTNLEVGDYQVYVKDKHGCGLEIKEVVLLHYPNFFTPNGDGFNDRWRIKYSALEPNLQVTIFDRYGKVITSFGATSEGWDGTLNGARLPSTDYWFVVKRQDGREHRGHFAMLR